MRLCPFGFWRHGVSSSGIFNFFYGLNSRLTELGFLSLLVPQVSQVPLNGLDDKFILANFNFLSLLNEVTCFGDMRAGFSDSTSSKPFWVLEKYCIAKSLSWGC
jgi:hypothetical protein